MTTLREAWYGLRSSESPAHTAGDLHLRLCHVGHDLRVFAAVSGRENHLAVVIEVPKDLIPRHLAAANGRRVSIIASELPGLPAGRGAVVVMLRDNQFEDLFENLGECLVQEIRVQTSPIEAMQGVLRQIERWRRFLERRREILSQEEVHGLIGEIAILERLIHRFGLNTALRSWKAPAGSLRDFECPAMTIEVKTFMTSVGGSVRINDPLQLEPEAGVPLFLACQELARSTSAEQTLPGHIARVSRHFAQDALLTGDFQDALASAGYLPEHAGLYDESLSLGVTHVLQVREGFPRIKPSDIPSFVTNVAFSVEVFPLMRYAVAAESVIGCASTL